MVCRHDSVVASATLAYMPDVPATLAAMSSRPWSSTTCDDEQSSTACSSVTSSGLSPRDSHDDDHRAEVLKSLLGRGADARAPPPVTSATLPLQFSVNEDLGLVREDHDDIVHVEDAALVRLHLLRVGGVPQMAMKSW